MQAKKASGLQRKTPMKRGNAPLHRGSGLKSNSTKDSKLGTSKGLKSDPSKGLKRTPFRPSAEKVREQWAKENARAQEKAQENAQERTAATIERKKPLATSLKPRKMPESPRKRPSRPSMTTEERSCRQVVADRSEGMCEKCGFPGNLEKAHRIARSQGGKWKASNILDLCHGCHHGNHSAPQTAYDHGWHLHGHKVATCSIPVLLRKGWSVGWAVLDDLGGYEWVDGPVWDEALMAPQG